MRTLLTHLNLYPCTEDSGPSRVVEDAQLLVDGATIAWIGGPSEDPPAHDRRIDARHLAVSPGLIDSHTHLVYADPERLRVAEFEQKLEGVSYAEIARRGGGIRATLAATRRATEEDLLATTLRDVRELQSFGVTTVEIKASYATDLDNTIKELEVIRRVGERLPVEVHATYCPQTVPPEFDHLGSYRKGAEAFVDFVCERVIPELHARGLTRTIDSFCEQDGVGLSLDDVTRLFECAASLGWRVKLHADQLSYLGGASLVARMGGLSADHLEFTRETCIENMARAGTVATLLPGAFHYQRETKLPDVAALRAHGVRIALATDSNPGSSPITSPLFAMNLACLRLGLTPSEALRGMTRFGAAALGLTQVGTLEPGKRADLAFWDVRRMSELAYHGGRNPCVALLKSGETVFDHASLGV
jgi:imidazolonepropionase